MTERDHRLVYAQMPKAQKDQFIRLQGVRHNNLKGFDLDLPKNRLIVITGLSGSGKSSLAFDTLYAEGQRRYIETFSPYARQFFDRMDKPKVDKIEGIPPAIAIEQRNSVKTTRSTVGTMTEITDYMKSVWPHLSKPYCPECGDPVSHDTPQTIWTKLTTHLNKTEHHACLISFQLPLSSKLSIAQTLQLVERQGYQRLLDRNQVVRINDLDEDWKPVTNHLQVVQDRCRLNGRQKTRFLEACEQAFHYGKGRLFIDLVESRECVTPDNHLTFTQGLHCAPCDRTFQKPSPSLFSFNHPAGACPECRGFGRIIAINYEAALPDKSLSLKDGVVKPWRTGHGLQSQDDLEVAARREGLPLDIPFRELPKKWQDWVIQGDKDYGKSSKHRWPKAWYGVKGYFDWLESKAYKMHVRVLLSRYRDYRVCPACHGHRLQPESLIYKLDFSTADEKAERRLGHLAEFYHLPISKARKIVQHHLKTTNRNDNNPLTIALKQAANRLDFLQDVGLGYLNLDRPTKTLSGGETERVNLTSCLGSHLVNTLYILDEPTVGLHPRDTDRLITILKQLRDLGNTVVVVEHEERVIREADFIVDIGPGHGETGGQIVAKGPLGDILDKKSLTADYLAGRQTIPANKRRKPPTAAAKNWLTLKNARANNLKDLTIKFPIRRLSVVSGVSGSGKSSLIQVDLKSAIEEQENERLTGLTQFDHTVFVDQSSLGKTPRSNPAVYIGAFDAVRTVFAQSLEAKKQGLSPGNFSFNSKLSQCPTCKGLGHEKIEMQFLSDVFIQCSECQGSRYRPSVLAFKLGNERTSKPLNIAEFLDTSAEEAIDFLTTFPNSRQAQNAIKRLQTLVTTGLGYLKLGQPLNTLSGGECQRLKLAAHLAEYVAKAKQTAQTLFIFDEPTTGLHFHDVKILVDVFQSLVDQGHTVIVVEHNLDVIRCADWIIDLGPESGEQGGKIVIADTPDNVAKFPQSHTGQALLKSASA